MNVLPIIFMQPRLYNFACNLQDMYVSRFFFKEVGFLNSKFHKNIRSFNTKVRLFNYILAR